MAFSDLQLKNASQVAFEDLQIPFRSLVKKGDQPPFTIAELCEEWGKDINTLFPDLNKQDISEWKIVDFYDTNKGTAKDTGFYGCVIDVGNGEAVVAFRGSEGMDDLSDLYHDWIKADFMLLNSTLTVQQGEVYKFLKQISKSDYINDYHSLGFTGHSLGGNLSMHAAVVSTYPEINLDGKLKRCVSYDGPGFSEEYLKEHKDSIEKIKNKIDHFTWSPVGALLTEFPGVERIPLEYENKKFNLKNLGYHIIARHSLSSLNFDGEDAVRGETPAWDVFLSQFSQGMDHLPKPVGDTVVSGVSIVLLCGVWMYDKMFDPDGEGNKKLTPFGVAVTAAAAVFIIKAGVITSLSAVFTVLAVVAIAVVAVVVYEYVYDFVKYAIEEIAKYVAKVCQWIGEKAEEFFDFVEKSLKKLDEWFKSNFDKGYKYSNEHPRIMADTLAMNSMAARLRKLNKRVMDLDERMDRLYGQVKLTDLWDLIKADFLTSYSLRLTSAASYLEKTASELEKVEKDLCKKLG